MLLSPINDNPIMPGTGASVIGMGMENVITALVSGEDLHALFLYMWHDLLLQLPKKQEQILVQVGCDCCLSPCQEIKAVLLVHLIP